MFSHFFIDRPIFASVISILITLAGALAAFQLPLAQYPPIVPPTIQVDCNYPGASTQVVAETIAAPIEQQVNGVEQMLYMSSQCTNDGSYTLTVTFEIGVDLNTALVLVQNRVNLALPNLPDVVKQTGVTTRKRSPDILLTVSLNCPSGLYDQLYVSNYAYMNVRDELARLPGISDILLFGQRDFSMRIWVDPEKLAARGLESEDVVDALRDQNIQVAMGQIGQSPIPRGQPLQMVLHTKGRLVKIEDFEQIVVKATPKGQLVRIKDIGRVTLGARSEDIINRFDSKPTVGLAVFQLADANALETADLIKAKMKELAEDFPKGLQYDIGYDTTPFIRESLREVVNTLRDAIILVSIVVLVFLQSWRSALIPLLAVPVAIIGTFAAMYLVGFSLNNLTLFGLVLAIGIVVDDAIVVVEAVEHHIESGLPPRLAARKAMEEVSGAVVAVGVVLSAVFIPAAFISGLVGLFFRQFALTIAISTIISTLNSLTLSPALAALLLRPKSEKRDLLTKIMDFCLGWFFRLFNFGFRLTTKSYLSLVRYAVRLSLFVLVIYGGLVSFTFWQYQQLPTGFIPSQDKGYFLASIQLPDASSVERTRNVIAQLEKIALETPGVKNVNSVAGNSFLLSAYGSPFGSMFIILKDFSQRTKPDETGDAILNKLRKRFATEIPEATVNIFAPPPVSGLGRAGGFRLMIEERGEGTLKNLQKQTDHVIEVGRQQKGKLLSLFTVFSTDSPQLFLDIDRSKCVSQGIDLIDLWITLQSTLGSRYVNDFNLFGRNWQVVVQGDAQHRDQVEDFKKIRVRNKYGNMVPLSSFAAIKMINGPHVITRYNTRLAAAINGAFAQGISSGDGIALFEEICNEELPTSMGFEWTELTYLERISTNTGLLIFGMSVIVVFLVLAALYESWSLPMAVILVVPMCVLGSIIGVAIKDSEINIFTQVGFVVLIGLACKNAILIVEFAKFERESGKSRYDSILNACKLRFRPIMMTSFAFILGVVPLLSSSGAGSEMRRAVGLAVFSGMIGVTLFGVILTPVFFSIVDRTRDIKIRQLPRLLWNRGRSVLISTLTFIGSLPFRSAALLRRRPLRQLRRLRWLRYTKIQLNRILNYISFINSNKKNL